MRTQIGLFALVLISFICIESVTKCHAQRKKAITKSQNQSDLDPMGKPGPEVEKKDSLPRDRASKVGDKGTMVAHRAKIVQIVDDNNALVTTEWHEPKLTLNSFGDTVTSHKIMKELVWLVGPTTGLVDDQILRTDQTFEVTGTKRYKTNTGTKTVLVLEPYDDRADIEAKSRAKEAQRQNEKNAVDRALATKEKRMEEIEAAKWRTWTDSKGTRIYARFGGVVSGNVNLVLKQA